MDPKTYRSRRWQAMIIVVSKVLTVDLFVKTCITDVKFLTETLKPEIW